MDCTSPGSWRRNFVCLFGLLSLVAADCTGNQDISGSIDLVTDYFKNDCRDPEYDGDLTIANITWPSSPSIQGVSRTVPLGALQTISGSLELTSIRVQDGQGSWKVDGGTLVEVSSNLTFSELEQFDMPNFQDLTTAGVLAFHNVTFGPDLVHIDELWPKLWKVNTLDITNTSLTSFGPTSILLSPLDATFEAYVIANANSRLTTLSVIGYGDNNPTVHVDIHNNNKYLSVDLPDIVTGLLNVDNVGDLHANALVNLGSPNDEFSVQSISNNWFTKLTFPNLTTVHGEVEIDSNPLLSELDLGGLLSVTSLRITNNSALRDIELPTLQAIGSSLYIEGPIDRLYAPMARVAAGQVTIKSWGKLDCKTINITQANGKAICQKVSSPTGGGGNPSGGANGPSPSSQAGGSSSGTSSGGLSMGAKIGIGVGVGVGVLAILAAVLFCCFSKRHNKKSVTHSPSATEYFMTDKPVDRSSSRYNKSGSPGQYTKVAAYGASEGRSSEERVSPSSRLDHHNMDDNWSPPEPRKPTADGRIELEEQQGMRHEMDARSLHDMEIEDDREETRSLEDIERVHGERPDGSGLIRE